MRFCPHCGGVLLIKLVGSGSYNFTCSSCMFSSPVGNLEQRQKLTLKEVDDVLGGEDAWKNVDATEIECPKCGNNRAFYMQIQIRSADEPMTTFYKCCKHECGYQWRSDS
eukprot:TRINITY_DN3805_c0_g1_i1.p1 TRINITY_DN3805_c0_g1~~TRINITY_DN3805_c0_g1_i1.p1  ORF type:complete len:110 (+),score=20.18 TRINITY_DN3805_c0_g1_i1:33-362(+)